MQDLRGGFGRRRYRRLKFQKPPQFMKAKYESLGRAASGLHAKVNRDEEEDQCVTQSRINGRAARAELWNGQQIQCDVERDGNDPKPWNRCRQTRPGEMLDEH